MPDLSLSRDDKTAAVLGATGLVGGCLVEALLGHAAYERVVVLSRKRPEREHSKLRWVELPAHAEESIRGAATLLPAGDDLFSALGTTRAQAGSTAAFRDIDYGINLAFARAALAARYNQYLLVSSGGAAPRSLFPYLKVKGELELAVKALPFWAVHIFQPSVLLGERNENRWGERAAKVVGKALDRLTGNLLSTYRPIEGEAVAHAMVAAAQRTTGGVHTHPNVELTALAESYYQHQA